VRAFLNRCLPAPSFHELPATPCSKHQANELDLMKFKLKNRSESFVYFRQHSASGLVVNSTLPRCRPGLRFRLAHYGFCFLLWKFHGIVFIWVSYNE